MTLLIRYPIGANGASQATTDARVLADVLAEKPGPEGFSPTRRYAARSPPVTTNVPLTNRNAGPERVLAIAATRVRGPEDRIDDLISAADLKVAGFLKGAV